MAEMIKCWQLSREESRNHMRLNIVCRFVRVGHTRDGTVLETWPKKGPKGSRGCHPPSFYQMYMGAEYSSAI